jgi:hypothetical protein
MQYHCEQISDCGTVKDVKKGKMEGEAAKAGVYPYC